MAHSIQFGLIFIFCGFFFQHQSVWKTNMVKENLLFFFVSKQILFHSFNNFCRSCEHVSRLFRIYFPFKLVIQFYCIFLSLFINIPIYIFIYFFSFKSPQNFASKTFIQKQKNYHKQLSFPNDINFLFFCW